MRCLLIVTTLALALTAPAHASDAPAPARSVPSARATAATQPKVKQRLQHDQAEVKRLEQDVATQESASQRASRRLQRQDEAIAELRRQLLELQSKPVTEPH